MKKKTLILSMQPYMFFYVFFFLAQQLQPEKADTALQYYPWKWKCSAMKSCLVLAGVGIYQ